MLHVTGTSKGKGFAGTMKRHGFKGQGASHGAQAVHSRLDRAGPTVHRLRAVTGTLAFETVALHRAGEALALGGSGDVDIGAVGEDVGRQFLAHLILGGGFGILEARNSAR